MFSFKTSSVATFVVPLRVEIMEEFYDSAFENLQRGKEYNRTVLTAYANYAYDRLCFMLVPLMGKINLGPRLQNKILVPFRGHFKTIRRAPPSLLYGSTPPPPLGGIRVKQRTRVD